MHPTFSAFRLRLFAAVAAVSISLVVGSIGCSVSEFTGHYSEQSFNDLIEQDKLVLVKFGSSSCPPCNRLDQELSSLESAGLDDLEIHRLSVGTNQELARKYEIQSIPRMMLFRGGQKLGDKVGFHTEDQVRNWVTAYGVGGNNGHVQANPFAN
jgi:thioredoxin-like negative regulator of GroEL